MGERAEHRNRTRSEDQITDLLEAEVDQERIARIKATDGPEKDQNLHLIEMKVAKSWTGCNKHFKDLLLAGWDSFHCLLKPSDGAEKRPGIEVPPKEGAEDEVIPEAIPGYCLKN